MEEEYIRVLATFLNTQDRERAIFYLQQSTRPDFDDDVPDEEIALFEAVDEQGYPEELCKVGELGLYWEMTLDNGMCESVQFPAMVGADSYIGYVLNTEYNESYQIFEKLKGGLPRPIFGSATYDDADMNAQVFEFEELLAKRSGRGLLDWLVQWKAINKIPYFPNALH